MTILPYTVFENNRKVSLNIASEASYVYILSGQKLINNAKNGRSLLIGQKIGGNAKIEKLK